MDAPRKKLEDPITRSHGFAHEHFVVLPERTLRAAARHPLLAGLRVTDAGHFPTAAGHRVERPLGAATHLVFACLRGRGWVRGGADAAPAQPVRAGDVVWLPAGAAHAYGAEAEEPWTLTYAHFAGAEAEAWMRHAGWRDGGPELLRLPAGRVDEARLDQVYAILENGYDERRQVEAAAALRGALAVLARLAAEAGPARSALEGVAAVRQRLRGVLAQPHRLDELAAEAGLSVPRFAQLFRRLTGCSAIDYLQRLRVQRACQRLATSDAPVATIATEVGYEDAFYFTRCFRRVMGYSPRAYRERASRAG